MKLERVYIKLLYSIFIITMIFIVAFLSINYFNNLDLSMNLNDNNIMYINGLLGWIILIMHTLTVRKLSGTLISLNLMFFLFFVIFNFGQSLLFIFVSVNSNYRNLIFYATNSEIIKAQFFTLICMCSFSLGLVWPYSKYKLDAFLEKSRLIYDERKMFTSINQVGWIMFFVSMPAFLYSVILTLLVVINGGYASIYGYGLTSSSNVSLMYKFVLLLSNYFLPSLICLFVSNKNKTLIRWFLNVLFVVYILYLFYIGVRMTAISVLIVFFVLHIRLIRDITNKQILFLIVLSYFFIVFINIVGEYRSLSGRNLLDYFRFLGNALMIKNNPIIILITELGWSMFPLISVMNIMPNIFSFSIGSTYLWALTSIIPNLGFWKVHPAAIYADGPNWLMKVLNMPYGPGFSLTAEAYRNFGWLGFILLIILGSVFGKIYLHDNKKTALYRPDLFILMLIIFSNTLITIRGDFLGFIRPTFFIGIPIYILFKFFYKLNLKVHL